MLAVDLGTWLNIVGIEKKESELERVGDWNTGERKILNNQII